MYVYILYIYINTFYVLLLTMAAQEPRAKLAGRWRLRVSEASEIKKCRTCSGSIHACLAVSSSVAKHAAFGAEPSLLKRTRQPKPHYQPSEAFSSKRINEKTIHALDFGVARPLAKSKSETHAPPLTL